MVSWRLTSSSNRPNRDPWGRAEVHFVDSSVITMVYRGTETRGWEGPRCRYAYSINQPTVPRTVAAGVIGSAVGAGVDFTRTLASLVSFLSADAERYETASRHGGTHPDGEPVEAVCQWAAEHTDELDELRLDLEKTVTGEREARSSADEPSREGSRL